MAPALTWLECHDVVTARLGARAVRVHCGLLAFDKSAVEGIFGVRCAVLSTKHALVVGFVLCEPQLRPLDPVCPVCGLLLL